MHDGSSSLKRGITEILALRLLLEDDQYGYRFVRLIRERSKGHITLTEGAIYTTMYRLEQQGYVKSEEILINAKRKRKYYSLTKAGREYADMKLRSFEEMADGIMSILEYQT